MPHIVSGVSLVVLLAIAGTLRGADCNGNGTPDRTDIERGDSTDCNGNGVPDACEQALIRLGVRTAPVELTGQLGALAAADFDGDGTQDVVLTTEARIGVLFQRDASPFEDNRYGNLFGPALALSAADLDRDGLADAVVAGGGSRLAVYWGDAGDGFVHTPVRLEQPSVLALTTAVDADPLLDIVALSNEAVEILLGEPDRTFRHTGTVPITPDASGVAAGDIDGDGATDLVVTHRATATYTVLRGDGQGGFIADPERPAGDEQPSHPIVTDLDADGNADLAHANATGVTLHAADGTDGFLPSTVFRLEDRPTSLTHGDVDSDGLEDLLVGNAERAALAIISKSPDGLALAASLPTDAADLIVATADFDSDGDDDLTAGAVNRSALRFFWQGEETALVSFLGHEYSYGGVPHNIDSGDIDLDGDTDLITANGSRGTVTVHAGDGRGAFTPLQTTSDSGTHFNSVAFGDLDGDGDLDAVTGDLDSVDSGVHVFLNRGTGFLERPSRYPGGHAAYDVATLDLDGDGDQDIFTTNFAENATSWVLLNRGDGTFEDGVGYDVGSSEGAAPGDFDADGDIDIAIAGAPPGRITVLENRGDAVFDIGAPLNPGLSPAAAVAVDVEGDGDTDLVACGSNPFGALSVLRNNGGGIFDTPELHSTRRTPFSLGQGDFDRDGVPDIATVNRRSDSITLLLNDGTGGFIHAGETAVLGREPRFLAAADLTGDAAADVAVGNHASASLSILINGQAPEFAAAYRTTICTVGDFVDVATPSRAPVERSAKYLLPARDDPELLPALFQNTRRFPLHQDFLASVFPDGTFPQRFTFLSGEDYDRLVGRRATRDYYVGSLSRVRLDEEDGASEGSVVYAFTVFADVGTSLEETLTLEEVEGVHRQLSEVFTLTPLAYLPESGPARDLARTWRNPPFPVLLDTRLTGDPDPNARQYEAYTLGVGYGRVRLYDEEAFASATKRGQLSFQDLLVLDFAPRDVEGVVAGVVTAQVQGELSHWSIRAARRGTPNAFLSDARTFLAPHEGELVRLEVGTGELTVTPAPLDEAEAFWAETRPSIGELPAFDTEYGALDALLEIDLSLPAPEARFGGKATHFARLQQLLQGSPFQQISARGFAIPLRHSIDFFATNTIPSALAPERTVTYAEYLRELCSWDAFQSDAQLRFEMLRDFREFVEDHGVVPDALVTALAARVEEVFGAGDFRVRFRSSSNVEDLLEFNGAGLYESTSVCVSDDRDADDDGPSRCDPERENERGIARGLKRVWASLWSFRAFEERAFFQIPHEGAAMGVLVTISFPDEEANGVAFTGNPRDGLDRRYVITAQEGEASVVSPEPGEVPERTLVGVLDGRAVTVERVLDSSLVAPGESVLSDEHLIELAEFMAYVDRHIDLPLETHSRREVLLDFEFKVDDGALAIKQVRPFLLPEPPPPAPTFTLEVDDELAACGVFPVGRPGRSAQREYETKAEVRFHGGPHTIPTERSLVAGELIAGLRFGPSQELARSEGPGFFRIARLPGTEVTRYQLRYTQHFTLADATPCRIELSEGIDLAARDAVPLGGPFRLDDTWLERAATRLELVIDGATTTRFASCRREELPLWVSEVRFGGNSRVELTERSRPAISGEDTAPASLVGALVDIEGQRQTVTDYWRLVYSARRHNLDVVYWVVLEPPLEIAAFPRAVRVVEVAAPRTGPGGEETAPAQVSLLADDFSLLEMLTVTTYSRQRTEEPAPRPQFQRGDVDSDGRRNLVDAIAILDTLFAGQRLACESAADTNDDGRINIADPIVLLSHVFGLEDLRHAPLECGSDPTVDRLSCGESGVCQGR